MATIEKTLERLKVIENAFEDINYDLHKLCHELAMNIGTIEGEVIFGEKAKKGLSDAIERMENNEHFENLYGEKEKNVFLENYKACWSDVESDEVLYNHFENLIYELFDQLLNLVINIVALELALNKAEEDEDLDECDD